MPRIKLLSTTKYKLAEKVDRDAIYSSNDEALKSLVEEVKLPMSLEDALDELVLTAKDQGRCEGTLYGSCVCDRSYRIEELKKYILTLCK